MKKKQPRSILLSWQFESFLSNVSPRLLADFGARPRLIKKKSGFEIQMVRGPAKTAAAHSG
jgi:hypothetical protein